MVLDARGAWPVAYLGGGRACACPPFQPTIIFYDGIFGCFTNRPPPFAHSIYATAHDLWLCGVGMGIPLQRGSVRVTPRIFLKICFVNLAFSCHERQKLASVGAQNCTVKNWRCIDDDLPAGHKGLQTGYRLRLASRWRRHWR